MFKAFISIVVLVVLAGGIYFLSQKGLTVSFNSAVTPTVASISTSGPTPSIVVQNPSVTSTQSDEEKLKAAVKAGLIAEHGQDAASMTVTVSTADGDYAKGMVSEQGGGGIWFAAKTSGVWKLVWDGNGIIDCSVLTPYPNFPTNMIPECYDSANSKMLTR